MRNHNEEYRDGDVRKYAYDFDGVIRRYLLKTLQPYLRRDGSALELGCYKGDMTEQLLGYFGAVTVVEAASDLANVVRNRFPGKVEVLTDRFESVSLSAAYDNIFLIHTLEHLDDPVAILTRALGWLAPQGRLFVAVPNANALSRQIAVKMGLVEHHAAVTPAEREHGHRRTYSMDVLLAHLRSAGCHVEAYGGILVKPLANYQFDKAIAQEIVDEAYLDACQELAKTYPELSATLYAVCSRSEGAG